MRQPIHNPGCVLQRPRLAALLGQIAADWALVEVDWSRLYALLLGNRIRVPKQTKTPSGFELYLSIDDYAFKIFQTVQTKHLRIKLTNEIAESQLNSHQEWLDKWKGEVSHAIDQAGGIRNKFVHGVWGISPEFPDSLVLFPKGHDFTNWEVYNESDFSDAIARIADARRAISFLYSHLMTEVFVAEE